MTGSRQARQGNLGANGGRKNKVRREAQLGDLFGWTRSARYGRLDTQAKKNSWKWKLQDGRQLSNGKRCLLQGRLSTPRRQQGMVMEMWMKVMGPKGSPSSQVPQGDGTCGVRATKTAYKSYKVK